MRWQSTPCMTPGGHHTVVFYCATGVAKKMAFCHFSSTNAYGFYKVHVWCAHPCRGWWVHSCAMIWEAPFLISSDLSVWMSCVDPEDYHSFMNPSDLRKKAIGLLGAHMMQELQCDFFKKRRRSFFKKSGCSGVSATCDMKSLGRWPQHGSTSVLSPLGY